MTNPDLAALSAAANRRAIALEARVMDSWQLTLVFGTGEDARDAMRKWADAYRAGRLVHIDEGMREWVAKAMCRADPEVRMGDADGVVEQRVQLEWKHYLDFADAALAAMMGGAK